MGLDVYIRKHSTVKTDSKGQQYWKVTQIGHLRNTRGFIDELEYYQQLPNCCSAFYTGKQLWKAAKEICSAEERYKVTEELKECKIKATDETTVYEVHIWF